MTDEEKITNNETRKHIHTVGSFITDMITGLCERIKAHDHSKLESPELEIFTIFTPKLKGTTYGSDEYRGFLKEMKPAIDHHNCHNRHHPEFHKNHINDMTLIDLVEMICDWKAASMRHDDGDIMRSIDINEKRFNISPQLADILRNTAREINEKQQKEDINRRLG